MNRARLQIPKDADRVVFFVLPVVFSSFLPGVMVGIGITLVFVALRLWVMG